MVSFNFSVRLGPPDKPAPKPKGNRRWWLVGAGVFVAAAAAGCLLYRIRRKKKQSSDDAEFVHSCEHQVAVVSKTVKTQLEALDQEIASLEELRKSCSSHEEFLRSAFQRLLVADENITKLVLQLDGVVAQDNADVRRQRKELLAELEKVALKLHALGLSSPSSPTPQ